MSLRDNLDFLEQGLDYQEEAPNSSSTVGIDVDEVNSNLGKVIDKEEEDNPFKKRKVKRAKDGESKATPIDGKKALIGVIGVIAVVGIVVCCAKFMTKDQGTDWMQEMEEEGYSVFSYSSEERALLRENGYTADDIERLEAEEQDPYIMAKEAENLRKEKYDAEIKPYLDGASPEYQKLKSLTWLGTGTMSSYALQEDSEYEERYGTYNVDYQKIPSYGSQLFLKLSLIEFDTSLFMTVTPERYMELNDNGNIVVVIEYNKYDDGKIIVTNIYEKDIKE